MSILSSPLTLTTKPGRPGARLVAVLAIVALAAACSSAATPAPTAAPTPAVTPTPAATPTAATGSPAAVTASPTINPTGNDFITPAPSVPLGTPLLVDPFISAGIATTVDTAAHAVEPSTYRTTIPGDEYHVVFVVFALKPDAVGKVTMVMTFGDVDVLDQPLTIEYAAINSWGDFKVNFPADGIPAGNYKAVMTYEPTGAQVVQYFTVD